MIGMDSERGSVKARVAVEMRKKVIGVGDRNTHGTIATNIVKLIF